MLEDDSFRLVDMHMRRHVCLCVAAFLLPPEHAIQWITNECNQTNCVASELMHLVLLVRASATIAA